MMHVSVSKAPDVFSRPSHPMLFNMDIKHEAILISETMGGKEKSVASIRSCDWLSNLLCDWLPILLVWPPVLLRYWSVSLSF
jgi:hypothetical protein